MYVITQSISFNTFSFCNAIVPLYPSQLLTLNLKYYPSYEKNLYNINWSLGRFLKPSFLFEQYSSKERYK